MRRIMMAFAGICSFGVALANATTVMLSGSVTGMVTDLSGDGAEASSPGREAIYIASVDGFPIAELLSGPTVASTDEPFGVASLPVGSFLFPIDLPPGIHTLSLQLQCSCSPGDALCVVASFTADSGCGQVLDGVVEVLGAADLDTKCTIEPDGSLIVAAISAENLSDVAQVFSMVIGQTYVIADLDNDCLVDGRDLGMLLGTWGGSGPADLDGSGIIDAVDLGLLLGQWTS